MLASMWSAWRFKSPSILLCLCTDEYPLMVAGSCQYHGWRSKVRLSDYMRCVVCLDLSGHTTSPCVLSLCKTLFAFFGMLLVVVGYHLVLDGPHVLRCVLSNIRCYMQCMCVHVPEHGRGSDGHWVRAAHPGLPNHTVRVCALP